MRNDQPQAIVCGLCEAPAQSPTLLTEGWVSHGFHGRLYYLCPTCRDERQAVATTGPNGEARFAGVATLADLEQRVAALEQR